MSEQKRSPNMRAYQMRKRADDIAETRQRIVEAAVRLHGTIGPAATTISALAEEAGVTRLTCPCDRVTGPVIVLPTPELRTERLVLRGWTASDRDGFAVLNTDPEVMEHLPSTLPREESDALVDRIEVGFEKHGFGLWAVEVTATGEFIGFTGLSVPSFHAAWMDGRPQQPVVEVGWRLKRTAWGHGYASEAARASLDFGLGEKALREIVSFTTMGNVRSQAVMKRIGMTRLAEYAHPIPGHVPLPSVVYHVLAGI